MIDTIRRWLIGPPLPTEQMSHERLGRTQALAVLSSDALSSVAYATEEILWVLMIAGTGALSLSWPIAIGISALLLIVASSYYQTVHAYPAGGGAYLVTKDNLGTIPSLIAGGSLLIDYVLTVAVSTSAGVEAITSAFPALFGVRVLIAVLIVGFITVVNLRGVRESGRVFAVPTYFFITTMFLLIGMGLAKWFFFGTPPSAIGVDWGSQARNVSVFLLLRAFASGCTALTGVEAISDGVPIFKKPEADNAGKTLITMVTILVSMFLGITWLANHYHVMPREKVTVVAQLAMMIFGKNLLFYLVQIGTALILVLAANTSFSDFPRLSMWMALDKFMPRQMANLGDRLVYANGIVTLGTLASLLIILFGASTHALIPLYAVGVFISFTLSQSSMVLRWYRKRTEVRGWYYRAFFNGLGAISTGVVLLIIAGTKFVHGAWIVLLMIPIFVWFFLQIHAHYLAVAQQLSMKRKPPPPVKRHTIIVPVSGVHRGVVKALEYARTFKGDLKVVMVDVNPVETEKQISRWHRWYPDLEITVIPSPYRSVVQPLVEFIDQFIQEEGDYVTIVMPEFIPAKWWHHLLHNETAWTLKMSLLFYHPDWRKRYRIITDVPFYLTK